MWKSALYLFVTLTLLSTARAGNDDFWKQSEVEYANPQAAFDAMSAKPGVVVYDFEGWTIVADESTETVWSFPPRDSAAWPSAVSRRAYASGDAIRLRTDIMCGGTKPVCDRLAIDFVGLNERLMLRVNAEKAGASR